MPTKIEKDVISGKPTTGHEWDGIRELNTPLPKWWLYLYYASVGVGLLYFILLPAIPGLDGYTKGLLGYSQRETLAREVAAAKAKQAPFMERIGRESLADIRANRELLGFALAGGRTLFAENCAPCHAAGGAGRPGYPNLADDIWLWGGTLDDIHVTIRNGIRWPGDPDTRLSSMPGFGATGLMNAAQMNDVAEFVLSLSGSATDKAAAERGQPAYARFCAACHGQQGEGRTAGGAPAFNDKSWLYDDDKATIIAQIDAPKHGVMPAWTGRLDAAALKVLTVYVHSLGGGK